MLYQLSRVVEGFLDRVEIVVADNASTDETKGVVDACSLPIRYGRQSKTVGFTKNVLFATTELARGQFIWLVGDDDLILPDALKNIFDSFAQAPNVDYHYLNFGWINISKRDEVINEQLGYPKSEQLHNLQFNEKSWQFLNSIESLTTLSSKNISAAFSGIFCFVCRRKLFTEGKDNLWPSDSLDGSSVNISDCFPHAMLTLAPLSGKPVAFISEPCLLQGINGWEWGGYAYKNMILGTYQLFNWLETSPFNKQSLAALWESYYLMAARLFARMLHEPNEHLGKDLVLKDAIPFCVTHPLFWDAFMAENKMLIHIDVDVERLATLLHQVLAEMPNAKIGLWGVAGRGAKLFRTYPEFMSNLTWITDINEADHGLSFMQSGLFISAPASIQSYPLDILVIGTRQEFINDVYEYAASAHPSITTISLAGINKP